MKVELLFWEGCPSVAEARELLVDVLGGRAAIETREVTSQEEAEVLRFPGSPTIRIDGRDVDEAGAAGRPSLSCRIYHLTDGRISPVPSREALEVALKGLSEKHPGLLPAAKQRAAASSVAPVSSGYARSLRPGRACFSRGRSGGSLFGQALR